MMCFECDNTEDCTKVIENINCPHCGEHIECVLNMCSKCGLLWKSVNDTVIDRSVFRLPNNLFSEDGFNSSYLSDLGVLPAGFELDEDGNVVKSNKSMSDYVHKCIKCNGVCYEKSENIYKCIDCGFELEVVDG